MSQENVEIARRAFAAFERTGDLGVLLELSAEDIVWDVSRSDFPDKGIYHGLEGVQEWMRGIEDAFADLAWASEEITDLGQDRVLVVSRLKGHGQFSKIGIDYRLVYVLTFRDDIVVRVDRTVTAPKLSKSCGLRGRRCPRRTWSAFGVRTKSFMTVTSAPPCR